MISILDKLVPLQLIDSARQLREHLRTPLYANAYLLILNRGLSAGLGIIYWVIAARFYSTEMVGKGSAIISTLAFLSALAELSLKSGMQRFVPRAGKHVKKLILLTYGVIFLATGILAVGFFVIGGILHFSDNLLGGMSTTSLGFLVIATMIYTVFIVQDGVLMGLHQTLWVLLENTIYNISKMALLVVGISGILGNGIVASWFIPAPLVVLIVNGLIFSRFIPRFLHLNQTPVNPIQLRQLVTSVTGDHVGTVLSETSIRLIPLMVINMLGTSANAFFYQAWLIGTMLYLVSYDVSASFTVEGASNPSKLAHYSRQMLRQMVFLIVPMSLVLLGAAPYILRIYGEEYARQATPLLRWLALAALPYGFNSWFLSYSRVRADIKSIILNQGLQCVLMIGLSYWWIPIYGISSIGLAWLIAQTSNSVLVIIKTRRILFQNDKPEERVPAVNLANQLGEDRPQMMSLKSISLSQENSERASPTGGVYLFLSPHLDDAVLSCGGYISKLTLAGEKVVIATFFTADITEDEPISWLARRNLRAWSLAESRSPFAERCREDIAAARRLGVETIHLGLLDALYRRKDDGTFFYPKKTVGVPLDKEDKAMMGGTIQELLREIAKRYSTSDNLGLFAPLGIGEHVDHVLLRSSAEAVFGQESLTYYEEIPYAARSRKTVSPVNGSASRTSLSWMSIKVLLTSEEIEARIEASACYVSQIPGLFPSPIVRSLEILNTWTPIVIKPLLDLHRRMTKQNGSHERMVRSLKDYITRVGGEKYWHVSSKFSGEPRHEKIEAYGKK